MKNKKHKKIIDDYEKQKSKHLEKLASKMLEKDEHFTKLKQIKLDNNFLNLF